MSHEYYDVPDEFDAQSAIAASAGLTCRFEVLVASLSSKISGALYAFIALVYAVFGAAFLYFFPTRFEIDSTAYSLMPSLLVILLFAATSAAHYILTLRATRRQAEIVLERQALAQMRVERDLAEGYWK